MSRLTRARLGATACALVVAVLVGLTPASPASAQEHPIRGAGLGSAIPDSYIVMLRDSPASRGSGLAAKAATLSHAHHGQVREVWTAMHGFSAHMSAQDAKRLALDSDVAYVQQDQLMASSAIRRSHPKRLSVAAGASVMPALAAPGMNRSSIVPAATQSSVSWGLDRVDQHALPLDGKYNYDDAAGQGSTVYVIGTGIDPGEPDFGGRATLGPNFVTDDGQSSSFDCLGGGTEMAGVVAGTAYGVAKKAKVVGIRVFRCSTGLGDFSWIVSAFNWVIVNARKPAVVDFALADECFDFDHPSQVVDCDPNQIAQAITAQEAAFAAGVAVVANAGDSDIDNVTRHVGAAPHDFYVGATTQSDAKVASSNFGANLTMFAPGENVSTDSPTGPVMDSGTHLAASYVAGTIALFMSKPEFAGASPATLRTELVTNRSTPGKISGLPAGTPNLLLCTCPLVVTGTVLDVASSSTSTSDGPVQLVGVTPDAHVARRVLNPDGSWGPWTFSASKGWQSAGAGLQQDGNTVLAGLTPVGDVWRRAQSGSSWLNWRSLDRPGTASVSQTAFAANSDGRLSMFAMTRTGKFVFRNQPVVNSATWSIWHDFTTPFPQKPISIAAATNTGGRIVAFAVDEAGRVWQVTQTTAGDTSSWSAWSTLGDFGMAAVSAARNADGRIELVGVDSGGNPWRRAQASAGSLSWSGWTPLPAKTLAAIGAETDPSGRVLVIGIDNLGNIWQANQSGPDTASYNGWTQIDGKLRP